MKTLTTLFAATALMASVSTAALAQVSAGGALDASGGVSVDAGSTSVDAGASTNANANASSNSSTNASGSNDNLNAGASTATGADATLNYGMIISDLNTSTTTAADIEALGTDVQIDVVTLSELRGNAGENASALDQALSAQERKITRSAMPSARRHAKRVEIASSVA